MKSSDNGGSSVRLSTRSADLKSSWVRFPRNYYERFETSLRNSPGANRLLTDRFSGCDFRKITKAAIFYVKSPQTCFLADRQIRVKKWRALLHEEARELKSQIRSGLIIAPNRYREKRLEAIETELSRLRILEKKRYGRKYEGNFGDHTWLFLIREYLEYKSGCRITGFELAAIVKAAREVLGYERGYQLVPGSTLLRRLQRFEKSNPDFCYVARQPQHLDLEIGSVFYPRSVQVIESLPS
jgi:hypothetical protein